MNNKVKSQKGITLIALVITVIVVLILAGIGIGELSGNKSDIKQTKNTISKSELNKIQQVVIENYLKYKQLGNERFLIGTRTTYSEANTKLKSINRKLELENRRFV